MYQQEQIRIPYDEYKAMGELLRAHLNTHEGQLRAMIAFGDIVTKGNTFDIDLLEVVEGWQGPTSIAFGSSAELPLRGQLRLHLLTPEEFENPSSLTEYSKQRLMDRVQEEYNVIYEDPPLYAINTLTRPQLPTKDSNPLNILVSGGR